MLIHKREDTGIARILYMVEICLKALNNLRAAFAVARSRFEPSAHVQYVTAKLYTLCMMGIANKAPNALT